MRVVYVYVCIFSFLCLFQLMFTLKGRVFVFFFFQAEDGIRDRTVTGVQTCALPIYDRRVQPPFGRHTARDRERDGERQGYDSDNDPRDQIAQELVAGVSWQCGEELRNQPVQISSPKAGRGNVTRASTSTALRGSAFRILGCSTSPQEEGCALPSSRPWDSSWPHAHTSAQRDWAGNASRCSRPSTGSGWTWSSAGRGRCSPTALTRPGY